MSTPSTPKQFAVEGKVLGMLSEDVVTVIVATGHGLADGGIPTPIPLALIAPELRMPNTLLELTFSGQEIISVAPAMPDTSGI